MIITKNSLSIICKVSLLFAFTLVFVNINAQGIWTSKNNFGGGNMCYTITGFVIGTKAYVGTGSNGVSQQQFWEWDKITGQWTQKASFPGAARFTAVGFSIGAKGYLGTGGDAGGAIDYGDFWEYDPNSLANGLDVNGNPMGLWTRKADFGGGARHGCAAFSIGNKGYIGTGSTGNTKFNDFWEYDTASLANGLDVNSNPMGAWTTKANLAGVARNHAIGFSMGTKGYIGTGNDQSSVDLQDFWEWDQLTNAWVQKANLPGIPRYLAVGFTINNKAYIGTGQNYGGTKTTDFWEWDSTNLSNGTDINGNPMGVWIAKANYAGSARGGAFGFSIGCNGYIGAGFDGSYTQDFREWNPVNVHVLSSHLVECANSSVTLGATGAATYQWSPGTNLSGTTGASITANPSTTITYTVTGSDGNGCTNTDSVQVTPFPGSLSITQTNVTCYGGNNGTATATEIGATAPYQYLWSTGETTANISNLTTGTYSVTVTDASINLIGGELVNNGDFNSGNTGFYSALTYTTPNNAGKQYFVGTAPAGWNSNYCACTDHTSGTGNFIFLNGDGSPHDSSWCQTITVTPNTLYHFSAWVTTLYPESPADLALLQIYINDVPQGVSFNTPGTCCTWQQIFSTWNSGNNTSARICVVNNCLSSFGNDFGLDDISFRECAPACALTDSVTIISPPPIIVSGTSASNEFCNRNDGTASVILVGNGPYTYLWNPSNQTTAIATSLDSGTYSVTISDTNACTHDTTVTVNFTTGPVASISADTSICFGQSAVLIAEGGNAYSWSQGGLTTDTIMVNPSDTTMYMVRVTNTQNGCIDSATTTVAVMPTPTAVITSDTSICTGLSVTMNASGGGTYLWNTGATSTSITLTPNADSTISVSVLLGLCADTAFSSISLKPLPTPTISGNTAICVGDVTTLTGNGGNSYIWNTGATTTAIIVSPSDTSTFSITAIGTNGCSNLASVLITVNTPPVAVSNNITICNGEQVLLTATGGTNYSWNTGDATASISVSPTLTKTYTVTVSEGNCFDTATSIVTVNPTPIASAGSDATIYQGQSTELSASGGDTYLWSNDSISNTITVSPTTTTTYCVRVTNAYNCVDSACIKVTIETHCGTIVIPTAFSPNGDGYNDFYVVEGLGTCVSTFSFLIFDRWGEKIFETTNQNNYWDGTYKGLMLNSGVFVCYLEAELSDGTKIKRRGNISLIK